ncbi:MAG: TonB-dependent receptor plug domain-containing protein [Gemmatimonadetes bacterium]|nr:TonB-dependent receptor plug domain-containing protein [Gemmatimonadota bacterium]NIR77699.1 TonB-dependent receptor plug domain-containing protein [Gemmatimonadota bacterium]NIT86245.1 TonB-dependent receptor plug domain-containing protein [Gemmatimonadota bacterium]NIU30071.1 TonB-dependent receptor plug domain-containing protein [Gemmatimonadota bacterium]NIV60473.1 TonB-dependent receptor plug domain-containing protein [Gemmatimonadota bacterium]
MGSFSGSGGWIAAALALTALNAPGQETGMVSGTVVSTISTERGEPVPGVGVRLPEIPLDGVTDDAGRFEFPIVPVGELEIRAQLLGCVLADRTIEVRRNRTTTVAFTVDRPAIELSGVVARGVSAERPEVERPFAAGHLNLDERAGHPGRSIADLLRGEFPGVKILEGSGQPGSEVRIQFRGPASISGDRPPLLVVDGIITAGGFVDLNPSDVQSITVLKGSAASAEYGSRGEAGVIEITTWGGAIAPPPGPGPLVVVDGEISEAGLSAVDPRSVVDTELIAGARAGALFGAPAAETGVIRITTREGTARRDPDALSRCVPPPD